VVKAIITTNRPSVVCDVWDTDRSKTTNLESAQHNRVTGIVSMFVSVVNSCMKCLQWVQCIIMDRILRSCAHRRVCRGLRFSVLQGNTHNPSRFLLAQCNSLSLATLALRWCVWSLLLPRNSKLKIWNRFCHMELEDLFTVISCGYFVKWYKKGRWIAYNISNVIGRKYLLVVF